MRLWGFVITLLVCQAGSASTTSFVRGANVSRRNPEYDEPAEWPYSLWQEIVGWAMFIGALAVVKFLMEIW